MNRSGNPASLEPSRSGNFNRLTYGAWSERAREGRAAELAQYVADLSPVKAPCDGIACRELGALLAHAEAIDGALAEAGPLNRRGQVNSLLDLRLRVDRRIEAWVSRLGLDPSSRARLARDLAGGSLAAELRGILVGDE